MKTDQSVHADPYFYKKFCKYIKSTHGHIIFIIVKNNCFDEGGKTNAGKVQQERLHPNNGRYIPITDEIRRIIELARAIPGESPYLFHDEGEAGMIKKDSYELNLRRRCKKLGCVPTNNHAFRMAFNSKLIEMGFSSADRALILGHNVQTNEAHYSLTDKRRLDRIKRRLNKEEP